jgi:hypothetical protein
MGSPYLKKFDEKGSQLLTTSLPPFVSKDCWFLSQNIVGALAMSPLQSAPLQFLHFSPRQNED